MRRRSCASLSLPGFPAGTGGTLIFKEAISGIGAGGVGNAPGMAGEPEVLGAVNAIGGGGVRMAIDEDNARCAYSPAYESHVPVIEPNNLPLFEPT